MPALRGGQEGRSPVERPGKRSHYIPRTNAGRGAVIVFGVLLALTQPPAVYAIANRVTPWILGLPFLYAYLLGLYVALIAVLLWAVARDV